MSSGRVTEFFSIDDFPGFFSGISKSKLPPGAMVDWGVGKGTSRTMNVRVSNEGELINASGFSRVVRLPVHGSDRINSCFVWEPASGSPRLMLGTDTGILALQSSVFGSPHDHYTQVMYPILFDSSTNTNNWVFPSVTNNRSGKFVAYDDRVYYCDGVGFPLRFRASGTLEPMGIGNELSASVVSIAATRYPGSSAYGSGSLQYWFTLVSRYGESPGFFVRGTPGNGALDPGLATVPQLAIDWTTVPLHVYGMNVYRLRPDTGVPLFLTHMSRYDSVFQDTKRDSELGYGIPLDVGFPSIFRTMEIFEDRMFAVGGFNEPNRISCSQIGEPDVWPALNVVSTSTTGRNDMVEEIREVNGSLFVFNRRGILRLIGSSPDNYTFQVVSTRIGCIARKTMMPWEDGLVFLSGDGIYFFNGSRLTRMSGPMVGLFQRSDPGAIGWDRAVGAICGDTYYLSYPEADETAYRSGGAALGTKYPNRVLSLNMTNGKMGIQNELPFFVSAPFGGGKSIVGCLDSSMDASYLMALTDYPTLDIGAGDLVDSSGVSAFFADLNLGQPDRVKVVEYVEVEYECLKELAITVDCYRSYPLTDAGTTVESVTATAATPTGTALWGQADTWSGESFGMVHLRRKRFPMTMVQGKSFNLAVRVSPENHEFRMTRVTIAFNQEKADWAGAGV